MSKSTEETLRDKVEAIEFNGYLSTQERVEAVMKLVEDAVEDDALTNGKYWLKPLHLEEKLLQSKIEALSNILVWCATKRGNRIGLNRDRVVERLAFLQADKKDLRLKRLNTLTKQNTKEDK